MSEDSEMEAKTSKVSVKRKKPIKTSNKKDEDDVEEIKVKRLKKDPQDDKKSWTTSDLLAEMENIAPRTSVNIISLFDEDLEIPFIARYRRELTGNLEPDRLRDIKNSYQQIVNLELKATTVLKNIEKENLLTPELKIQIESAKSLEELELLYAPFKPTSKGSLFERGKKLGLLEPAESILSGSDVISLEKFVNQKTEGLENLEKVQEGVRNIISHLITKNSEVLAEIRKLRSQFKIVLTSTLVKSKKDKEDKKDQHKFENYFEFSCPTTYLKPHQILAINRGEDQKILSVKLQIDERVKKCLKYFTQKLFNQQGKKYSVRTTILEEAFNDAYSKKIVPLIQRQERADLTKMAEKASIKVFADNLKQLLLQKPNREVILGIDPGFSHGCKLAMISENGDVLETTVFHLHQSKGKLKSEEYQRQLSSLLKKHKCTLIALGNGTGCRETESWLTELFEKNLLDRSVRYCIVNEQGASIYSCGPLAKKEFPDMDVNVVSAISIARRLLDPMAEYVKIDSKHLGVGQYQHDINEKQLTATLNEIVVECVSFVGVDVNSTSETLLKHVAGLSLKQAEAIIQHRLKNGPFKTREEILKVKGVGKVAFKNCAGFLMIDAKTAGTKTHNLLDSTWVHPESYEIAEKIIKEAKLSNKDIGKRSFVETMKSDGSLAERVSKKLQEPVEKITTVINCLQREMMQDYRNDFDNKPLFKQGLTKSSDLRVGQVISGAVTNNTDFGSFIDIGVHENGLIHRSKMNGMTLKIGDRVEVKIISLELQKGRIGLQLQKIL